MQVRISHTFCSIKNIYFPKSSNSFYKTFVLRILLEEVSFEVQLSILNDPMLLSTIPSNHMDHFFTSVFLFGSHRHMVQVTFYHGHLRCAGHRARVGSG